jgi:hypothetical protein
LSVKNLVVLSRFVALCNGLGLSVAKKLVSQLLEDEVQLVPTKQGLILLGKPQNHNIQTRLTLLHL